MSPLVKLLCSILNKSVKKRVSNGLQRKMNKLIQENMVSVVRKENKVYVSGSKNGETEIIKLLLGRQITPI